MVGNYLNNCNLLHPTRKLNLVSRNSVKTARKITNFFARIPLKLPPSVFIILYRTILIELIHTRRNIPVKKGGCSTTIVSNIQMSFVHHLSFRPTFLIFGLPFHRFSVGIYLADFGQPRDSIFLNSA